MEYASITIGISLVGLIVTLVKIYGEQIKSNRLKFEQDKRLEYKLRIHDLLLSQVMDYQTILSKFQSQSPLAPVNPLQIRKCIYEMLVDKTIVAFDDGLYTVDTVTQNDDVQDQ